VALADITPTEQEIADVIATFAVADGVVAPTFTAQTSPSLEQAQRAAAAAAPEVEAAVGGQVPDSLIVFARRVAAFGAAADLVLSLRGEDSDARQSLHAALRARHDAALDRLVAAVEALTGQAPGDGGLTGGFVGHPEHSFPDPDHAVAFWD
jgi:hypothetical protein